VYSESINGVLAFAMAETSVFGDFPHPSKIIRITFLLIIKNCSAKIK
jgi:hypothetical protein